MAYFPFFIDLAQKEGLIVGGGGVALGKTRRLLPYGPRLTVAAPELLPDFYELTGVALLERPFTPELLEEKFFVIAATGDMSLDRRISRLCREKGILVNVVDDQNACTFLFPSLVKRGSLSAGVSTGGASPGMAAWLRREIEGLLPERTEEILEFLRDQRQRVKASVPGEKRRAELFQMLLGACLDSGGPISQSEADALLEAARGGEGEP